MERFEDYKIQHEAMIHKILNSFHIHRDRDEFFQLGLIGLWEALLNYDPTKGKFISYAYLYVRGAILTELKKRGRHSAASVYPEEAFWEMMSAPAQETIMEKEEILSYCGQLTNNQKKWVLYACLVDLSVKEIAEIEGVSESAVKQWKKGALGKLRLKIKNGEIY